MRLKALHGFCIGSGIDVVPGQEFDATDAEATYWINNGSAVAAEVIEPRGAVTPDHAQPGSGDPGADPEQKPVMDEVDDGSGDPVTP